MHSETIQNSPLITHLIPLLFICSLQFYSSVGVCLTNIDLHTCKGELPDKWSKLVELKRITILNVESPESLLEIPDSNYQAKFEDIHLKNCIFKGIHESFFTQLGPRLANIFLQNVSLMLPLTMAHFQAKNSLKQVSLIGQFSLEPNALTPVQGLSTLLLKDLYLKQYPENLEELLRTSLSKVELTNTRIRTLPYESIKEWHLSDLARSFDFTNSPLHCDKNAVTLHGMLTDQKSRAKFSGFVCASPPQFANKNIEEIPLQDLEQIDDPAPIDNSTFLTYLTDLSSVKSEEETDVIVQAAAAGVTYITISIIACLILFVLILIAILYFVKRPNKHNKFKPNYNGSGGHTAVIEEPKGSHGYKAVPQNSNPREESRSRLTDPNEEPV